LSLACMCLLLLMLLVPLTEKQQGRVIWVGFGRSFLFFSGYNLRIDGCGCVVEIYREHRTRGFQRLGKGKGREDFDFDFEMWRLRLSLFAGGYLVELCWSLTFHSLIFQLLLIGGIVNILNSYL
jgi:hypothetical protein